MEESKNEQRPQYDPQCYLCPGNKRATGAQNDNYKTTYVFTNDYSAVHSNQPPCTPNDLAQVAGSDASKDLFRVESVKGQCKVVCFSPRHDLTLAELTVEEIKQVVQVWQHIYTEMSADPTIEYVQLFENKGSMMGCSNPHPHGQMWALSGVPSEPAKEIASFKDFSKAHNNSCLLCSYVTAEQANACKDTTNRVILQNDSFVVVVPFWAVWPFEAMIVAKDHVSHVKQLNSKQVEDLAQAMQGLTIRYDNLFQSSFPYSMGLHQSPTANHKDAEYCHLHLHFYPPLLRSAAVRKFLVGFEMMAEPQRDLTAEQAAARLRSLNPVHYKHN
ncbi:galactose-1-phosphate uridyl transferase [Coemansia brasiliensis]|uniref:Galactose-1-phosphate uridylyltransferase n=1 Tax=Coemansia brasiliensis TaxID=2650707 RepID=A0A9W8M115_9FUNG|nr:galactose-1-phosphate uridyl transferase [Coemansia brasiliensis]